MNDSNLREYTKILSDADISYLYVRFQQRLGGDMGEISEVLARSREIDRWLASAKSFDEWDEMFERLARIISEAYKNRKLDRC
jgi:hypothetical protein